jgi:hypothetical protein
VSLFEDKASLISCEDGKCGKCWMCEIDKNNNNNKGETNE